MAVKKIGLVGCGSIGTYLAIEIQRHLKKTARLSGICDQDPSAAQRLKRRLNKPVAILPLPELVRASDLVVEAASPKAVGELLPWALRLRKGVMVLSTGGLLGCPKLLRAARRLRVPIHLPSGAVSGMDALKAHAIGKIRKVVLTTRKPLRALPASAATGTRARLLFKGSANEAVARLPYNLNVAATLSLAGLGGARTQVRVIADPKARYNVHEVEVVGQAGRLISRTENRPMKENPKTSLLAAFSAVATLREILEPGRVGG
jgi:aspartate dehydrogenase